MATPGTSPNHDLSHSDLVLRAEAWLKGAGCGVTFREFVAQTPSGEIPDAIGWRHGGISILIECKATRADFLADKKKQFRAAPQKGAGDWRFYLAPEGLISPDELPHGWGLLCVRGKRVLKIAGVPTGQGLSCWEIPPFEGHRRAESALMLSALRRLKIRGHLEEIYDPMPRDIPELAPPTCGS